MPEAPEVESLVRYVAAQAGGKEVSRTELASFAALKTFDPPFEGLRGRTLEHVERRGKFLCLRFGPSAVDTSPAWFVTHLARGGWLKWHDVLSTKRAAISSKSPLAVRIGFSDGSGFELTEAGTEKRLAAYVVRDPQEVEGVARLGPDPLDPGFDVDALAARLATVGGAQVKGALADQAVLAGVGNAYSDEVLHAARLSPYKAANKLTPEDLASLHRALVEILTDAVERSRDLPAKGLKAEKKEGLKVHGRAGQACPDCGDTVREVSFATKKFQYCPTCQTGGKPLADRRLSRLLK